MEGSPAADKPPVLLLKFSNFYQQKRREIAAVENRQKAKNALLLSLLITAITAASLASQYYLAMYVPLISFPILPILSVAISTRVGGFSAGLFSSLISMAAIVYYLPKSFATGNRDPQFISAVLIFLLSSLCVSYLVENNKYYEAVKKSTQKEKELLSLISAKDQEFLKARDEIRARDEFLSVVSHELKTPLTSMILQIQTALYNIKNVSLANFSVPTLIKKLEESEQQSFRLAKMINDLLNASLITTGRFQISSEKINLSELTRKQLEHQTQKSNGSAGQFVLKMSEDIVGYWDRIRIEQVISNLISNAQKYGDGKPITIAVKKSGKKAVIAVSDHGIGIDKDSQKKIFTKFGRAVYNDSYKGLGIGLYISNQIVNAHGGSIKVKSKYQKGTTFSVELPLQEVAKTN